jgi:hypothetical protein
MTAKQKSQLKSLWFARWISMCYADTFVDPNKRRADGSLSGLPAENGGISVLNAESGKWWAYQLAHFEHKIYPQWLKKAKEINDLSATLEIINSSELEYNEEERKSKEDPDYLLKKIEAKEELLRKEENDIS